MAVNLNDQALIQTLQLLLYFSALILVPTTVASLVGSWLQRVTGTNDGTLSLALRIGTVAIILTMFGAAFYQSCQELLRLVLGT